MGYLFDYGFLRHILLPSITKLVNCSLHEGAFPADLKKVVVISLIKKASLPPDDFKKYQPVSGLCFISKLVERVVTSQLNDYVCSNINRNVKQLAYKLGHSTEPVLLSIKIMSILLWLEVRPSLLFCSTRLQCLIQLTMVHS